MQCKRNQVWRKKFAIRWTKKTIRKRRRTTNLVCEKKRTYLQPTTRRKQNKKKQNRNNNKQQQSKTNRCQNVSSHPTLSVGLEKPHRKLGWKLMELHFTVDTVRLCRYFETSQSCWLGDQCLFAHGEQDRPRPQLITKTPSEANSICTLCWGWANSWCSKTENRKKWCGSTATGGTSRFRASDLQPCNKWSASARKGREWSDLLSVGLFEPYGWVLCQNLFVHWFINFFRNVRLSAISLHQLISKKSLQKQQSATTTSIMKLQR